MQTRLPFFGVVRVSGEDRALFLHGQLSNDINNLASGQACYATYNTPKGRVLANMLVVNRGEDLLLVMAQDLAEAIVKRLRMFVLRAKVVFELMPDLAVSGELADNAERHPAAEPQLSFPAQIQENTIEITLPHTGRLKISAAENAAEYQAGAENAWNLHEIRSGYPWICAATKEAAVAQMLNQQPQPKKRLLPKCSTNTSSAPSISVKAATPAKKSSPGPNTEAKSNAVWPY